MVGSLLPFHASRQLARNSSRTQKSILSSDRKRRCREFKRHAIDHLLLQVTRVPLSERQTAALQASKLARKSVSYIVKGSGDVPSLPKTLEHYYVVVTSHRFVSVVRSATEALKLRR